VNGFDVFRFQAVPWSRLLDDVRYLEAAGARTVWIADHYVWPPTPEAPLLESWTTLAALAAATERVRLATAVTDVALRNPALLAKQVATVDCISGGRVEIALGAGFWERELESIGIPFLTPRGRADRLREGVEIVEELLRERRLSYQGEHFRLDDAVLVPEPVQQPRPPLYVAANGRRGLRLAAERADGSLSLGDEGATMEQALAAVRERNARLDEDCAELGRDPGSLDRAYFVGWADERPFASAEALHDFIGRYREAGVRRFVFAFASEPREGVFATRETLEAFAAQVFA
jgi:alkanesulfonate monooxygenase SsuD/methylene tetrahydromethanopterin reductase-like flavin-dependent oxidoreductase (luciferase family)